MLNAKIENLFHANVELLKAISSKFLSIFINIVCILVFLIYFDEKLPYFLSLLATTHSLTILFNFSTRRLIHKYNNENSIILWVVVDRSLISSFIQLFFVLLSINQYGYNLLTYSLILSIPLNWIINFSEYCQINKFRLLTHFIDGILPYFIFLILTIYSYFIFGTISKTQIFNHLIIGYIGSVIFIIIKFIMPNIKNRKNIIANNFFNPIGGLNYLFWLSSISSACFNRSSGLVLALMLDGNEKVIMAKFVLAISGFNQVKSGFNTWLVGSLHNEKENRDRNKKIKLFYSIVLILTITVLLILLYLNIKNSEPVSIDVIGSIFLSIIFVLILKYFINAKDVNLLVSLNSSREIKSSWLAILPIIILILYDEKFGFEFCCIFLILIHMNYYYFSKKNG